MKRCLTGTIIRINISFMFYEQLDDVLMTMTGSF